MTTGAGLTSNTCERIVSVVTRSFDYHVPESCHSTHVPDLDSQAWFWTEEWQAGERQADLDKQAGRVIRLSAQDIQQRIRKLDDNGKPQ